MSRLFQNLSLTCWVKDSLSTEIHTTVWDGYFDKWSLYYTHTHVWDRQWTANYFFLYLPSLYPEWRSVVVSRDHESKITLTSHDRPWESGVVLLWSSLPYPNAFSYFHQIFPVECMPLNTDSASISRSIMLWILLSTPPTICLVYLHLPSYHHLPRYHYLPSYYHLRVWRSDNIMSLTPDSQLIWRVTGKLPTFSNLFALASIPFRGWVAVSDTTFLQSPLATYLKEQCDYSFPSSHTRSTSNGLDSFPSSHTHRPRTD